MRRRAGSLGLIFLSVDKKDPKDKKVERERKPN